MGKKSATRQFVAFAAITLGAVVLLGLILGGSYRSEATRRGLAQGRSEAQLMAHTAVEPLLDGRPLSRGLSPTEQAQFHRLARDAVAGGDVQRLRLRDLAGAVVFSDDGSGFHQRPEDEALDAAHGTVVARLTRINTDSDDSGQAGPESVEVYLPSSPATITSGSASSRCTCPMRRSRPTSAPGSTPSTGTSWSGWPPSTWSCSESPSG